VSDDPLPEDFDTARDGRFAEVTNALMPGPGPRGTRRGPELGSGAGTAVGGVVEL